MELGSEAANESRAVTADRLDKREWNMTKAESEWWKGVTSRDALG